MTSKTVILSAAADVSARVAAIAQFEAIKQLTLETDYPLRDGERDVTEALHRCHGNLRDWADTDGQLLSCGHVALDGSTRVNLFPWALVEALCDACAVVHFAHQQQLFGIPCGACGDSSIDERPYGFTFVLGCAVVHTAFCGCCAQSDE